MMPIHEELAGRTVMVVGGPSSGKTAQAQELARALAGRGPAALVSADMGQQAIGVPTCTVLSMAEPYDRPDAMWFIGDVSPRGSMLPSVVGTAQLVRRAKAQGAQTVVIDTTGMIEGQPGFALKYHKALAAGVDAVVGLQRESELELLLEMLGGLCPMVHRMPVAAETHERSAAQRAAYRQERYAAYFEGAEPLRVDAGRLLGADWAPHPLRRQQFPLPGALVGLLDAEDFCLGIGLVEKLLPGKLVLFTPWTDADAVARMRLGKIRLDRQAGCVEAPAAG